MFIATIASISQMKTIYCYLIVLCLILAVQGFTVVPQQIPFTDPEITNPGRGFFTSYGINSLPMPQLPYMEYYRFSWNNVEKALNQYDWTNFDAQARRCCNRAGCTFAFRYMATQPEKTTVLPTYLTDAMTKDYFVNNTYAKAWVPDWNDPYFIQRSRALLNATAAHILSANLTCVKHSDIGIYGWWGEGHMTSVTYPLPNGAQAASIASLHAYVDMHLEAFKGMQFYALSGNEEMTFYAFSKSPSIGMRRDSLGNSVFDDWKRSANWTNFQNRWKTAPLIAEPYGQYPTRTNMSVALRQVKEYHVSAIANNINGMATVTNATVPYVDQQYWLNAGKSAGFRLTIEQLVITEPVQKTLKVNITWNNHGIAAIYLPWNVNLALVSSTSVVTQIGTSKVDLRSVMPETPVSFVDSFDVSAFQKGTYSLQLQIVDPTRVNVPLALAIRGAAANNKYTFGTFNVDPTTAVPPTAAPVRPPVAVPTVAPVRPPTVPVATPVKAPTASPTAAPVRAPTAVPTAAPIRSPTATPIKAPTAAPLRAPTVVPTVAPVKVPTASPTTAAPTKSPAASSILAPTTAESPYSSLVSCVSKNQAAVLLTVLIGLMF